jgi:hypothetical protein
MAAAPEERKGDNLSDLDLPISGLYLLAAPSTPGSTASARSWEKLLLQLLNALATVWATKEAQLIASQARAQAAFDEIRRALESKSASGAVAPRSRQRPH